MIQRATNSENFIVENPENGMIYTTRLHSTKLNILQVFIEPNDDQELRTKSLPILSPIDPLLKIYAQEYLLPTMYEENGIGIASIQCGIPLRLFIVDIPRVITINGNKCEENNPRYVREAVAQGKKLKVLETRPKYLHGECQHYVIEKLMGNNESDIIDEIVVIERHPIFILNPHIENMSNETIVIAEGCLSVPAEYVSATVGNDTSVMRPLGIEISYTNFDGDIKKISADGSLGAHEKWLSRCIQHEYDHLEGILYTDRLYHEEYNTNK